MEFYYAILNSIAAALISTSAARPPQGWVIDEPWHIEGPAKVFTASSTKVIEECKREPDQKLHLPLVVQGFHELYLDGDLFLSTGDNKFKKASATYNLADIKCENLVGSKLTWKVRTTTFFYANIYKYPYVYEGINWQTFLCRGVSISMSGGTIFLAFFLLLIFKNYFRRKTLASMFLSGILVGTFLILTNPEVFFIEMRPIDLHRLHDVVLWIGMIFCWIFMTDITDSVRWVTRLHIAIAVFSVLIIISSRTLDQAQVGSSIAFVACLIFIFQFLGYAFSKMIRARSFTINTAVELFGVGLFCVTAINDLLINFGILDSVPVFTVGFPFVYALLSVLANMKITQIQAERDHLATNLESEVASKTASLNERTVHLESTLGELKKTQAELVHSSKMASLGTLAAGIAHEINNALNYPMGAAPALKRILEKDEVTKSDVEKAKTIVSTMTDGLYLTADIIKNLKRYSGRHSSQVEQINVKTVLENTIVLCRNHLKQDVTLNVNVPDNLIITGTKAGLSQVFMNIINNAADAMDKQLPPKTITVSAEMNDSDVLIHITDTGPGIPEAIQHRIFDPFFTTKAEGKGTGLGLFIVNKEVQTLQGKLTLKSKENEGTTFTITVPKNPQKLAGAA